MSIHYPGLLVIAVKLPFSPECSRNRQGKTQSFVNTRSQISAAAESRASHDLGAVFKACANFFSELGIKSFIPRQVEEQHIQSLFNGIDT